MFVVVVIWLFCLSCLVVLIMGGFIGPLKWYLGNETDLHGAVELPDPQTHFSCLRTGGTSTNTFRG